LKEELPGPATGRDQGPVGKIVFIAAPIEQILIKQVIIARDRKG
jgi:hypothetical protein